MNGTAFGAVMAKMGYLQSSQRPACQNCGHAKKVTPSGALNDMHSLRCQKGSFGTTAMAICGQHEWRNPKRKASP